MIKQFEVTGLNGFLDYKVKLHPDLNIFTGKNGSGKTTLLKLIWYMLSPNIERTIPEILFSTANLETEEFQLSITRKSVEKRERVYIKYTEQNKKIINVEVWADEFREPRSVVKVEEVNRRIVALPSGSLFFPTFRRIEGGFSLEQERRYHPTAYRMSDELSEAISEYTNMMTVRKHKFIASISTKDIEDLLTSQYADLSDRTNVLHSKLSNFISSSIGRQPENIKGKKTSVKRELADARDLLEQIRGKVIEVKKSREELMKPFSALSKLIQKIFKDKGIRITHNLTFGEAKDAIRSAILSAGEKQMLSFLCYNAFTNSSPIFIDEPELSLHIDWQRLLFPTLLSQGSKNQFVVSTHSPFIYSKYPDKEFLLDKDRGDN